MCNSIVTDLRYAVRTLRRRLGFPIAAMVTVALGIGIDFRAWAQPGRGQAAQPSAVVRGIYNWVHTTGDAERSFAFYRDVFDIELAGSPFVGPASERREPEPIRPRSDARSDPLVWDLTDTEGSRFRTVFMHAPNTPFGLELSEFFDIPRGTRQTNPWDPGASTLIFAVRDLAAVVDRLNAAQSQVVTLGESPLDTPIGRSVIVRDPDGYLVQVTQASPAQIAEAASPGSIVGTSIGISVADRAAALEFYRDLLGFEVRDTRRATAAELQLHGLADGVLTQTTTVIPGTGVGVQFSEFALPAAGTERANAFRWRIQDVGAPQFQLQVQDLDTLLQRTTDGGYRFLSVGARPIQRPFGRFVFAIDADGVLVEFVEPDLDTPLAAPQR
jgi:predicted enzyme related to lactoylglutathione lyase